MTLELTAADAGTRRSVRVGDVVTVRLAETPTSGFRWQADYDGAALRPVDDGYEAAQPSQGGGGVRALGFEALRAGPTTLRLANKRSWESAPPAEEFSVELDVEA